MAVYLGTNMVNIHGGQAGSLAPTLQTKTYIVDSAGTETITADSGYDGLSEVEVSVPSAKYVLNTSGRFYTDSNVRKWRIRPNLVTDPEDADVNKGWVDEGTFHGDYEVFNAIGSNTVITPTESAQTIGGANYMMEGAVTVEAMPSGTAGTPTATKGAVSDNSVSITPSVTNSTGYITGGTKTGTAITVSASELVSGTLYCDEDGSWNVTNAETFVVDAGTVNNPTATKGTVTNHSVTVTPSVSHTQGWISSGTKTGTTVTVTASELVSGTYMPSSYGNFDVTNYATVQVDGGSAGTPVATKGNVNNHQISVTPSVTNVTGWITGSTKTGTAVTVSASELVSGNKSIVAAGNSIDVTDYATVSVASGSATAPATVSGTAATVSTGTNTLTLTKTVSVTPTVSAGYISSGTAGNSSVSLTASVTTKAAATYHPSTTDQTISASQYLTGAQTIKAVTMTNLTAANIKKDVVVKIGDATDDDCVTTITGTYEGSSGGAGLTVDTSTTTLNSAAASISFTGLAGEPTSFAVVSAADLATGASPWKTAAVIFDGTDLHGQTIRNTSNAQVSYDGTAFSKTYSNGTLTITGSGTNFQANQYKLVYTYGGSDIGTADVQVGSGATTITFTGLSEEPSYFSCIFKSNFSTSSGYQRAITVVYDGTSVYGLEMDSGAHYSDVHWSYTYNNGSLTITSQSTNAGGYFHQPGYYQLTYATEGESGNYQSKTVYATSSQQVVQADSGYDALKKVTIPAVTTTNLSASNILSGVTIQVGDAADSDRIASVTGNVVLQNYYTGSSAPSSSLGNNGDLYLQS